MEARARKRPFLLILAVAALLLASRVQGEPQGAAAELASAAAPAAELASTPPRPAPSPAGDDAELTAAEAALAEADGDGPRSLAGALPSDVAALIGEVPPNSSASDGEPRPVKELPPPAERQGEQVRCSPAAAGSANSKRQPSEQQPATLG